MAQQYGSIQPTPRGANPHQGKSYPTPDAFQFIQPQQHAPIRHVPLAQAPSSFMPPPSLPDGRRALQKWPGELSEEQRQIQEQYTQTAQRSPINPYYAQPPPSTSGAPVNPIATYAPSPGHQAGNVNTYPLQRNQSSATYPPTAPSMTTTSLPSPAPPAETSAAGAISHSTRGSGVQQTTESASTDSKPQPPQSINTHPQQPTASNSAAPKPQPASPFEGQRVTALLEINRVLLVELNALQTGNSAPTEPPSNDPTKAPQPRPNNQPSAPHYVDFMRRLQSNLAYLASVADRPHKPQNPVPAWPAIMDPPARRTATVQGGAEESDAQKDVKEMYEGLRELWPEWKPKEVA